MCTQIMVENMFWCSWQIIHRRNMLWFNSCSLSTELWSKRGWLLLCSVYNRHTLATMIFTCFYLLSEWLNAFAMITNAAYLKCTIAFLCINPFFTHLNSFIVILDILKSGEKSVRAWAYVCTHICLKLHSFKECHLDFWVQVKIGLLDITT